MISQFLPLFIRSITASASIATSSSVRVSGFRAAKAAATSSAVALTFFLVVDITPRFMYVSRTSCTEPLMSRTSPSARESPVKVKYRLLK